MRWFYDSATIRAADERAQRELNVPGVLLMENAGRGAAEVITSSAPNAKKVVVLCGPGNNGGDGFAVARHLLSAGLTVSCITSCSANRYKGDAKTMRDACEACGVTILSSAEMDDDAIQKLLWDADVVVDALLGTGSSAEPHGEVQRLIIALTFIHVHDCIVVSLDIPSGTMPDSGEVPHSAVHADITVSFLEEKVCHAVAPGSRRAGTVRTVGLGVPASSLVDQEQAAIVGFDTSDIPYMRPFRMPDAHKGHRGGLLVVGGSKNYRGAPILAARAALRAGCGYVYLAVPDFMASEAAALLPEAIVLPIPLKDGEMQPIHIEAALAQRADKIDAALIGPGMGRSDGTAAVVRSAIGSLRRSPFRHLLLDADALYHLKDIGVDRPYPYLVITPHAGEAAHLLGISPREVNDHRLDCVRRLAARYGTALLKGERTLIASKDEVSVIIPGGPELAVPGSGDVLAGVIGGIMPHQKPFHAATLGALVHAAAGERIGRENGMLASELADAISQEMSS